MIPAVLLFFAMMFLPESPRWLARMDRWEEAHDVLALVHAKGDRNHPFVAIELQDIRDMCELERSFKNVTYLDLFSPRMLNRTLIGLLTQIWSQLTGMNVMSKPWVKTIPCRKTWRADLVACSVLHWLCICHGRLFR